MVDNELQLVDNHLLSFSEDKKKVSKEKLNRFLLVLFFYLEREEQGFFLFTFSFPLKRKSKSTNFIALKLWL